MYSRGLIVVINILMITMINFKSFPIVEMKIGDRKMEVKKLVVGKGKTTRPSDFYRDAAREKNQREAP